MRQGVFGSVAVLLAGAGLALAQPQPSVMITPGPGSTPPVTMAPEDPALPPVIGGEEPGGTYASESRLWFSAEYLLWWFKKSPEPVPLVTSIAPGTLPVAFLPTPGALGGPGTTIALGGQSIDTEAHSGGRFLAGYWLDSDRTVAIEGSYFFLAGRSVTQSVGTSGAPTSPALAIPFFDVIGFNTRGVSGESAGNFFLGIPVTIPGAVAGQFALTTSSELQGAEANGVFNLYSSGGVRFEALAGFRWAQLRESLTFSANTSGLPGTGAAGFLLNTLDAFGTQNNFYGGQLGLRGEYRTGGLFVNATGKIALGDMNEVVNINGATTTNIINLVTAGSFASQTFAGGVFAQPTNIGRHSRNQFAVIPEVEVKVGYELASWARAFVGYDFLCMSDVVRPGDQIDRSINVTRTGFANAVNAVVPASVLSPTGPARPAFNFHDSSFWAQGINFGLEFRY